MIHETMHHVPEEVMEQRQVAVDRLASAALFLTSVENMWQDGERGEEIDRQRSEAGAAYNLAIAGLLAANQRIRQTEWGN